MSVYAAFQVHSPEKTHRQAVFGHGASGTKHNKSFTKFHSDSRAFEEVFYKIIMQQQIHSSKQLLLRTQYVILLQAQNNVCKK